MKEIKNKKQPVWALISGIIFVLILIVSIFSDSIFSNNIPTPWFLVGIYIIGLSQAVLFYIFRDKIFAKNSLSFVSSAAISYHAWACFVFGIMLIFNTENLLHTSTGFSSIIGNNNDRVALQLTQICGVWVLAYSLLSYFSIFFVKNNFVPSLLLHIFAIFSQFSEILIKINSDKLYGLGAKINTHHTIIQIVGLIFLLIAFYKRKNNKIIEEQR